MKRTSVPPPNASIQKWNWPFRNIRIKLKDGDGGPCRPHGLEAEGRPDQAFQLPVVGFQAVVQVLDLPVLNMTREFARLLQVRDRLA